MQTHFEIEEKVLNVGHFDTFEYLIKLTPSSQLYVTFHNLIGGLTCSCVRLQHLHQYSFIKERENEIRKHKFKVFDFRMKKYWENMSGVNDNIAFKHTHINMPHLC